MYLKIQIKGVPYLTKLKICVDSPNEHRTLEKIQLPVFEIEFFDLGSSSKWKVILILIYKVLSLIYL